MGGVRWTKEEIELLKDNYNVLNTNELLVLFSTRTKQAIQIKASDLNLKCIKTFNENIFDVPNNLNSYYAGFIAADGNIGDSNFLQISLQKNDSDFLEKFNAFMQCSRNVKSYEKKKRFKSYFISMVTYHSKKLVNDLKTNFLIKPRKTLNCPFPKHLSFNNRLSYIIGNLDGDGSIMRHKPNKFCIQWLGDFKFLNDIRHLFYNLGWIKDNTKYLTPGHGMNLYQLKFAGNTGKFIYRMLMIHIEKHELPVMERKWFNRGIGYISLKRIAEKKKLKIN